MCSLTAEGYARSCCLIDYCAGLRRLHQDFYAMHVCKCVQHLKCGAGVRVTLPGFGWQERPLSFMLFSLLQCPSVQSCAILPEGACAMQTGWPLGMCFVLCGLFKLLVSTKWWDLIAHMAIW